MERCELGPAALTLPNRPIGLGHGCFIGISWRGRGGAGRGGGAEFSLGRRRCAALAFTRICARCSPSAHSPPPPSWIKVSCAASLYTAGAAVSGAAVLRWELWSEVLGARSLLAAPYEQVELD